MAFLHKIFGDPSVPTVVKHAALARINADPGLPSPKRTESFWLSDIHPDFKATPTESPPQSAEYVIIGSGITGTSVARHLIRSRQILTNGGSHEKGNIVLLEAREVCGGATGRNGGHINEVGFGDYREIKDAIGKEAAMKILRFRLAHLETIENVAKEEGLVEESQVRSFESATVFYSTEAWEDVKHATSMFKEDFGEEAAQWEIVESEEGLKKYGTETAKGIIISRAGAAWPYRLITGILSNLQHEDPSFTIHQFTPVTKVEKSYSEKYIVSTPRGQISAKHVIHCTNSHVSHLIPGLRNRIFPVRGQMSAQTPPSIFPFQGDKRSWSLNYEIGFDYLTQLPRNVNSKSPVVEGGEMMLGGGMVQSRYHGIEEFGVAEDDELNSDITKHLSTALSKAFTSSREVGSSENKFKVKAMWSGSMGFSADSIPWVGRLEESMTRRVVVESVNGSDHVNGNGDTNGISHTNGNGDINGAKNGVAHDSEGSEWVSAGYTGEGMVNAWLCGKALALMVLGREKEVESWFPEQYLISEERLRDSAVENYVKV